MNNTTQATRAAAARRIAELERENAQLRHALLANGIGVPPAHTATAAQREGDAGQAASAVGVRDSDKFVRSLLDSSTDCIKVLDLDARLEMMSTGGMCVMEVDDFALIQGACWPDFWAGSGHAMALAAVEEAKAGRMGRFQGPAPTAKGTPKWWDVVVAPIIGPDGKPEKLLSVSRDITKLKAIEDALQLSRQQHQAATAEHRAVLAQLSEGVIVTDADGRITFVNEAAEQLHGVKMLGVPPEGYSDAYRLFTMSGEPYPSQALPLARAVRGESVYEARWRIRRDDGSEIVAIGSARPLLGGDGNQTGAVLVLRDETTRLAAEIALRETEERYRLAAQATRDAVWDWDMTTSRIQWNEALTELFGYAPDGLATTGQWWEDHIHPDDRERVSRSLHAVVASSDTHWSAEYRFLRSDGSEVYVLDRGAVVRDANGRAVRMIGAMFDLTERRRAEAALRELNETLEDRVAQAIAEREKAEEALRQSQKLESMGQLTGGVAHDFNNLLTPIIASLDMLQRRRIGDERMQRLVEGALQSAERAKTLVQRLLAFARRQPLQTEAVDVAGLIEGMADLVASTSGPRIRVDIDVAPHLPPAKADANQLELAILNLAVNARDAMPEGGMLTISAKPKVVGASDRTKLSTGRYICLSVSDTGVGMDEATLARAIEPFFSTKGIGKGTGLGLSMVHGLAAQLGGTLNIVSKAGLGTKVELLLPTCNSAVQPSAAARDVETPQTAGTALLVDDEELVRMSTADMLADLGYAVVEAGSAEEALRLLEDGLIVDLLVTDHLMPGMIGTELAREVRAHRPGVPVLVISGYAETDGIAADLPLLTKPFRRSDLIASLAEASVGASR